MITAGMSRQVDKSVVTGLVLGLGFTFAVVFLFERGIPQRLLRRIPGGPSELLSQVLQKASPAGSSTPDAGSLAQAAGPSSGSPTLGAVSSTGSQPANTALSNVEAPKESDTEVVHEPPGQWPLWALKTPRPGTELQLPPASHVVSLDLDPRGEVLALVLSTPSGERSLHLWRFDHELPSVLRRDEVKSGGERGLAPASFVVHEVAWSRFGTGLYVLLQASGEWRIEQLSPTEISGASGTLDQRRVVYRSRSRLSHLLASPMRYSDQERLFFAREHSKDQWQIVSTFSDGQRVYEVTSPTGTLGALSDPSLRKPADENGQRPPKVLRVRSAKPISINPASGRMLLVDGTGALSSMAYGASGWTGQSEKLPLPAGTQLRDTPNATLLLRRFPTGLGADLVDAPAQKKAVETVGGGQRYALLPVAAPTGRSVVGVVARGEREFLSVAAVKDRLAAVRYLDRVAIDTPSERAASAAFAAQLRQRGLWLAPTTAPQLYDVYQGLSRSACGDTPSVPIFASLDGFLEVLAAGFHATFTVTEQHVALPRLRRFLREIERVAAGQSALSRIGKIAGVCQAMLKGDYSDTEAKLVLAERIATSSLHTFPSAMPIDFARSHPRGPYSAGAGLQNYFRALMYLSELRASPDELRLLDGDAALRLAWRAWIETQSALLFETRLPLLFEPDRPLPAYVQKDCVPPDVRRHPRLFPLAFGIDSEIWQSVVAHAGLPESCQVPGRPLPSGLDLLTALGSDEAQAITSSDYAKLPALRDAHDRLRRRFSGPLATDRVAESWLRLVQLLATDRLVPEGIEPVLWRRRLLQTALASWTNYRHTTVRLSRSEHSECERGNTTLETQSSEPPRGVVDPLPEGWEQVARTLTMLAEHSARLLPDQPELGKLLRDSAERARAFGQMAARQLRGQPLRPSEYQQIQHFAAAIEQPYVKFKALLLQGAEPGLTQPEPMPKIVDVAQAEHGTLQLAVGRPLQLVGLFADRGLLIAARGAVYSYHELVAGQPLDDAVWRERFEPALPWTPQALLSPAASAQVSTPAPPSDGTAATKP